MVRYLTRKLFGQDPLIKTVARVKEHAKAFFPIFTHMDLDDIAHFEIVSDGADGTLVGL